MRQTVWWPTGRFVWVEETTTPLLDQVLDDVVRGRGWGCSTSGWGSHGTRNSGSYGTWDSESWASGVCDSWDSGSWDSWNSGDSWDRGDRDTWYRDTYIYI